MADIFFVRSIVLLSEEIYHKCCLPPKGTFLPNVKWRNVVLFFSWLVESFIFRRSWKLRLKARWIEIVKSKNIKSSDHSKNGRCNRIPRIQQKPLWWLRRLFVWRRRGKFWYTMILLSMMMPALNLLPETGLFPQTILPQPRPTQDDSLALKMTLELKQHAMKCNVTDVLGVFSRVYISQRVLYLPYIQEWINVPCHGEFAGPCTVMSRAKKCTRG